MISHNNRTPTQPGRRLITPEDGSAPYYVVVDFADEPVDEGAIVNKQMLDEFLSASGTTTGTDAFLSLAQDGFVLADGAPVRIRLHVDIVGPVTLNVQSTGDKPVLNLAGQNTQYWKMGSWVALVYSQAQDAYIAPAGDLMHSRPTVHPISLPSANWTGSAAPYEQTLTVPGVFAAGYLHQPYPAPASFATYTLSQLIVQDVVTDSVVVFHSRLKPVVDINAVIVSWLLNEGA